MLISRQARRSRRALAPKAGDATDSYKIRIALSAGLSVLSGLSD